MLTISPSPPLTGTIRLPGDKSLSHRAALLAALAEGKSRIENFLDAGVTRRMLAALAALGVAWRLEGTTLTVTGRGLSGLQPPGEDLDCGNSATTMRLLAGALAAAGIPAILDGSAGLRRRPMARIVDPLQAMGTPVHSHGGTAPLVFDPRSENRLRGGSFDLAVASAQVKSCLLLAGLAADGPLTVREPGPSRDHTERMLRRMGVAVRPTTHEADGRKVYETRLQPAPRLQPLDIRLPGDFSSAAFLIAAALVTPGSDLSLHGVGLNPTRTGLLDAFGAMGAEIEVTVTGGEDWEPCGDLRVRHSRLRGTTIAGDLVVRMIDEFPALAAAAVFASGETSVREAAELRTKESDRIHALCTQLEAIGAQVEELQDGFRITGGRPPAGGTARAHGDHRIAMAMVVAGLGAAAPVVLDDDAIIRESFPEFIPLLQRLGAQLESA